MSKFHLISTFDYEIFGDGSGCLQKCLLEPINQSLKIAERYGSMQTFFVDFLEFASLKAAFEQKHPLAMYYDEVEEQLKRLSASQHNIQLHLHPQWLSASPGETGWNLDFSKWRIGDLDYSEIKSSIEAGMSYARDIGLLENPKNCKVFRAGGWAIQPSSLVVKALIEQGIEIDSTVAPGAKNSATGDWFNFKNAPKHLPYWQVSDDVCKPSTNYGLMEVPISTQSIGKSKHFKALKEHKSHPGMPQGCNGSYFGPNNKVQSYRGKLGKVINMGTVMLDTSTLPAWALIEATEKFMERFSDSASPVPIVTIGHNKNFTDYSADNFDKYFSWAKNNSDITFSDYQRWLEASQA